MIKNITVHPKGATHVQVFSSNTYFLKFVEGVWLFATLGSKMWCVDGELNNVNEPMHGYCSRILQKIGEVNVNPNSASTMPPVGDTLDNQVIF